MNIKTKVLAIENKISVIPGVCQCKATRMTEFWHRYRDDEPTLQSAPVPNTCDDCLKPIEKEIIQMHFVESKINPPREK